MPCPSPERQERSPRKVRARIESSKQLGDHLRDMALVLDRLRARLDAVELEIGRLEREQ
jgi:hypothetical protein